jgi:hypothetical protein
MNAYYERRSGNLYELCQNRFRKNDPNHPHNVCAVGRSHQELKEMYEKYFTGGCDWLDQTKPTETEYFIKRTYPIGSPTMILYKLDESTDSLLLWDAIDILKSRGLSEKEADEYLNALEYVPTRGG